MSASRIGSTSSNKPSELPSLQKKQRTKTGAHEINEASGQKKVTESPSPSSHTSPSKTLRERALPTKVSEQDKDGYQTYLSQGKSSSTPETPSNSFKNHLVGPDSFSTEALYQHISAPDANKLGIALHSNLGELEDDDEEWPDDLSDSRQCSQTAVPEANQITVTINKPEPRPYYANDHNFDSSNDSTGKYTDTYSSTAVSDESEKELSESVLFLQELENLNDKPVITTSKTISTNNDDESGYSSGKQKTPPKSEVSFNKLQAQNQELYPVTHQVENMGDIEDPIILYSSLETLLIELRNPDKKYNSSDLTMGTFLNIQKLISPPLSPRERRRLSPSLLESASHICHKQLSACKTVRQANNTLDVFEKLLLRTPWPRHQQTELFRKAFSSISDSFPSTQSKFLIDRINKGKGNLLTLSLLTQQCRTHKISKDQVVNLMMAKEERLQLLKGVQDEYDTLDEEANYAELLELAERETELSKGLGDWTAESLKEAFTILKKL